MRMRMRTSDKKTLAFEYEFSFTLAEYGYENQQKLSLKAYMGRVISFKFSSMYRNIFNKF